MTSVHPPSWRALPLCLLALFVWQTIASSQAVRDWPALDSRVKELYEKGDLPAAIEAGRAALDVASSPAQTGQSLDRLGFLYYTAGNMADGQKYLQQSLDVREAAFGVDSLDYAETANDLALLLRDDHKFADARTLAERSVATRRRLLPSGDALLAESLNTAATVAATSGDYEIAVREFEQAMAIHESKPETERSLEEYGTLCINLAGTYQRLGQYALAGTTFGKGLGALRVRPGVDHPAYAVSLVGYAQLEADLGHYAEAERAYDEGGTRMAATLTTRHPLYASFLNNRGFLYQTIGNTAAAEADYRASLALRREIKSPPATLASALRNLSYVVYERDRAEGERLLTQAADAYAASGSPPAFDYASVLVGLGRAQRNRGALAEARTTLDRALTVSEQGLTSRHPLVAAALRELGLVYAGDDQAEAERTLLKALTVAESAHGPGHPAIAAFSGSLAEFYAAHGNDAVATRFFRRAFDIRDGALAEALEIGSERAKVSALTAASDLMPALMAFQARVAAQVPDARALAFEVVTQRKARVLDEVREWRQRLRSAPSDTVRARVRDWEAVVECRSSLTMALGYTDLKPPIVGPCTLDGTELEGRYSKLLSDLRTARTDALAARAVEAIAVLTERGDALEASLNRDARGSGPVPARVSVETMRAHLGADELLIELVSYQEPAAAARRRYGAFVLNNTGRLEWVDIGPAGPIDGSVRDMLSAANDWSLSLRNREGQAARASAATARDAVADLSSRLWQPLRPIVQAQPGVRRLRIAPDGALNLVPFEALSDGRELIDRFAISYVQAGRDLAVDTPRATLSDPVVIVSPGSSSRPERLLASAAPTFRTGNLAALPSAAGEASDLHLLAPAAQVLAHTDATERRLKDLHSPAFVHIIGHGVVLGDRTCAAPPCSGQADGAGNAMARSAIVLEEAYGRAAGSPDDGLLTPLELQNVDLRGTEMLVLSQCQMAAGAPSVGEGVYGMRRAAAIAGARTFVAPLWNVEDAVQRTLMQQFYRGLASGLTRAEALRRAKLAVRRSSATQSFLYWAPVILSGSPDGLPPSVFRAAVTTGLIP